MFHRAATLGPYTTALCSVPESVVSSVIAIAFAIAALLLAFLVVGDAFDEGE